MIRIDSYLHRTVLSELIRRWMYHKVYPADADLIARLINFNHLYVSRYLHLFTESVFQELYPAGVSQRRAQQYRGHLSKNIEYLMGYLFAFPMSVQRDLSELPIKHWNRYLPDYFDEVLKDLFHIPTDGLLEESSRWRSP